MEIQAVLKALQGCPCGRAHTVAIKQVVIERGVVHRVADILSENGFPRRLLVVTDENALHAAHGILENLTQGGFVIQTKVYPDLRVAEERLTREVAALSESCGAILSVGSGSCNDICRRAALLADKEFALFATAPSMDGFAAATSPITDNNFKQSLPARQPSVILGDTDILAKAPATLKVAGFGDVLAKYIALADWRISHRLTGEYYCEAVAQLVRQTLAKMTALCDRVTAEDPETAGAIMEALVWSGLLMKLADTVRPASGAEHMVGHYWEIKKLDEGLLSDFHGRKVGVATLYMARLYHRLADGPVPHCTADKTDWDAVYTTFGPRFYEEVHRLNDPTVTDEVDPAVLEQGWADVCRIVKEEVPDPETIRDLLCRAGAARSLEDIDVNESLGIEGLRYHPYLRHRLTLSRLLPMTDLVVDYPSLLTP